MMYENFNKSTEEERNINWEEVEKKISIITTKFNNIDSRYRDDLAQELRIHAFYKSDDYYDLTRKAIDFWRTMQRRVYPEVPFFDLELLGGSQEDRQSLLSFDEIVEKVKKELSRPGYNAYDTQMLELASKIFDIVIKDAKGDERDSLVSKNAENDYLAYFNGRISVTWVSVELDVHYKRVVKAMKFLEDTIRGLAVMGKIEIGDCYRKGYYED